VAQDHALSLISFDQLRSELLSLFKSWSWDRTLISSSVRWKDFMMNVFQDLAGKPLLS
jgi:hypothetical protein